MNTLLRHVYLVFSYCFSCGNYLTIDVGQTHFVIIYKVKLAYTASCKGFNCISAYTAYAENRNPAVAELFHCFFAE